MDQVDFQGLLVLLADAEVEFVIVGGLAAAIHGSAQVTLDLDVCYRRTRENIERLCRALAPIHPTLRDAPPDLPFRLDPPTVRAGLNFTLDTDRGPLDLLGEVPPFGPYEALLPRVQTIEAFGFTLQVLSLDALIQAKRAAGRPKDLLVLPELEALQALKPDED